MNWFFKNGDKIGLYFYLKVKKHAKAFRPLNLNNCALCVKRPAHRG
ncbi:hypothetical protein C8N25_101114 [Algoriphagus antarcticus]|uniref:Uncharacterized protein n=1 Tax=Algoriphagus antarcticus TaxID=238540 RepID=A0A3E0EAL3_9BACT|nr:hypothetical protein C8N25_101114 [Algoriphagus antarcticus]